MLTQAAALREIVSDTPMKVGDRVRVAVPVTFYHHPLHRNQPYSAEGMEGEIKAILTDWQGRMISPNFPIVVEFKVEGAKRPFKAHLTASELEAL
jgi:hypothetical protein